MNEMTYPLILSPGRGNPRNSEGDFILLNDGRLCFIYTRYTGDSGSDNDTTVLAARYSGDEGKTWTTDDDVVLRSTAKESLRSVSLLRIDDSTIALFYMHFRSWLDTRPFVRFSDDDGRTWGEAIDIVQDVDQDYYVLNNDRVIRLSNGRILVPVSRHMQLRREEGKDLNSYGNMICYLSDDSGHTWIRSRSAWGGEQPGGSRVVLQEPGVVELRDGRLLMYCRTDAGSQFVSFSEDGGETWTPPRASNLVSPRSPASVKRIPGTEDLVAVWNDHSTIKPDLRDRRTPLTVAISRDEATTWENARNLEEDPWGHYCYTAIAFAEDTVLLAYCGGDRRDHGLATTKIARVPIAGLY